MMSTRFSILLLASLAMVMAANIGYVEAKKKPQHRYIGQHPISNKSEDGYCFIEVPHVHKNSPHAKHKALYRTHQGQSHFVADPSPYEYEGKRHSYYGHHPIAVDVVLGEEPRYESGQQLEYCYLDGPHFHSFMPQPGLTFEAKGGVHWYIGELPAPYVKGKAKYRPGNRVYAEVEVERPSVEFDAPPVGYVGPVLEVHMHGHGHGHGHVKGNIGIGLHVDTPVVEIGGGWADVVVVEGHDHKHKKHHKHGKHKKHHKHGKHGKHRKHGNNRRVDFR